MYVAGTSVFEHGACIVRTVISDSSNRVTAGRDPELKTRLKLPSRWIGNNSIIFS